MSVAWLILAIVVFLLLIACAYAIIRFFKAPKNLDMTYLSIAVIMLIIFEVLLCITLFLSIYMAFR